MIANDLRYTMVIEWSDEDRAFVVTVPELPGCQTHGDSYEDALRQSLEAMADWVEAHQAQGRTPPVPRGQHMDVPMTFADDVQWLRRERVPV